MNMKDFLRGLGAGIIFSTLIMLVAYMTSGSYRISDDEIIKRAEKLGMVMQEKPIVAANDETSDESSENTTGGTAQTTTEAPTEGTTEDTTIEEVTTESTSETTTEATTEAATEAPINTELVTVEIEVTKGMSSEQIAKLVQDAGIIDDYLDFDKYLNANGYSNKLSVNTFKLNSKMSYEEIAKELTKGDR